MILNSNRLKGYVALQFYCSLKEDLMPLLKQKVNNRVQTYLIVHDEDIGKILGISTSVIAISPSIIKHGEYCASHYLLQIPDNPTYQQQQQQIAELESLLLETEHERDHQRSENSDLYDENCMLKDKIITLEEAANQSRVDSQELMTKLQNALDDLTNANQARDGLYEVINDMRKLLENSAANLLEVTKQRDGFSKSLSRTINHLNRLQEYLRSLPWHHRLLLVFTGYVKQLDRFSMIQIREAENDKS